MAEKQKHTLTAKEIEAVNKMSTVRLMRKLTDAGVTEEQVELMERDDLIRTWLNMIAEGRDKPPVAPTFVSPEMQEKQLEFERYKFELELQLRQQLEADRLRLEAEKLNWQKEQEATRQKQLQEERDHQLRMQEQQHRLTAENFERELTVRKEELEVRRQQSIAATDRNYFETQREENQRTLRESIAERAKRYGQILKNALPKMPQDIWQLTAYFDTVEEMFRKFEVPDDLQTCLLRPFLSERALSLLTHLDSTRQSNFAEVRKYLLEQFNLTAVQFRNRFNTTLKQRNESYALFANRLRSLLLQYLNSRCINRDFDTFVDLLISDRMHVSLPDHAVRYITNLEMAEKSGWLSTSKLAEALDNYFSLHTYDGRPWTPVTVTAGNSSYTRPRPDQSRLNQATQSGPGSPNIMPANQNETFVKQTNSQPTEVKQLGANNANIRQSGNIQTPRACFVCNSKFHVKKDCPHRNTSAPVTSTNMSRRPDKANTNARVFTTVMSTVDSSPTVATREDLNIEQHIDENLHTTDDALTRPLFTLSRLQANHCVTKATESAHQVDSSPIKPKDFSTLVYLPVQIDGCPDVIRGLCDSGAELLVLSRGIVPDDKLQRVGRVKLRGIFGDFVDADLVVIKLRLADDYLNSKYLTVHCAVCEGMNDSLILTADIVHRLKEMRHGHPVSVTGSCLNTTAIPDTPLIDQSSYRQDDCLNVGMQEPQDERPQSIVLEPIPSEVENIVDNDSDNAALDTDTVPHGNQSDIDQLIAEQKSDDSLKHLWFLASQCKSGYHILHGLLYHRDKILGQTVDRLVLPATRPQAVLSLAHDTSHVSAKRTRERIKPTSHWPTASCDINKYCETCEKCQLYANALRISTALLSLRLNVHRLLFSTGLWIPFSCQRICH
jgi:hypothetical protein